MNRRQFLKVLGIAPVVTTAPQILQLYTPLEENPFADSGPSIITMPFRLRFSAQGIERQIYLTKARTQPPKGCRECHETGRTPIKPEGDTPGYIDVPGWGRMYVLRGPMGPRWSTNGGHTGWAKGGE